MGTINKSNFYTLIGEKKNNRKKIDGVNKTSAIINAFGEFSASSENLNDYNNVLENVKREIDNVLYGSLSDCKDKICELNEQSQLISLGIDKEKYEILNQIYSIRQDNINKILAKINENKETSDLLDSIKNNEEEIANIGLLISKKKLNHQDGLLKLSELVKENEELLIEYDKSDILSKSIKILEEKNERLKGRIDNLGINNQSNSIYDASNDDNESSDILESLNEESDNETTDTEKFNTSDKANNNLDSLNEDNADNIEFKNIDTEDTDSSELVNIKSSNENKDIDNLELIDDDNSVENITTDDGNILNEENDGLVIKKVELNNEKKWFRNLCIKSINKGSNILNIELIIEAFKNVGVNISIIDNSYVVDISNFVTSKFRSKDFTNLLGGRIDIILRDINNNLSNKIEISNQQTLNLSEGKIILNNYFKELGFSNIVLGKYSKDKINYVDNTKSEVNSITNLDNNSIEEDNCIHIDEYVHHNYDVNIDFDDSIYWKNLYKELGQDELIFIGLYIDNSKGTAFPSIRKQTIGLFELNKFIKGKAYNENKLISHELISDLLISIKKFYNLRLELKEDAVLDINSLELLLIKLFPITKEEEQLESDINDINSDEDISEVDNDEEFNAQEEILNNDEEFDSVETENEILRVVEEEIFTDYLKHINLSSENKNIQHIYEFYSLLFISKEDYLNYDSDTNFIEADVKFKNQNIEKINLLKLERFSNIHNIVKLYSDELISTLEHLDIHQKNNSDTFYTLFDSIDSLNKNLIREYINNILNDKIKLLINDFKEFDSLNGKDASSTNNKKNGVGSGSATDEYKKFFYQFNCKLKKIVSESYNEEILKNFLFPNKETFVIGSIEFESEITDYRQNILSMYKEFNKDEISIIHFILNLNDILGHKKDRNKNEFYSGFKNSLDDILESIITDDNGNEKKFKELIENHFEDIREFFKQIKILFNKQ